MNTSNQQKNTGESAAVASDVLLSGISRLTLIQLKHGEVGESIHVDFAGPTEEGKYCGWITAGEYHRPLLNTQPRFNTQYEAEQHMRDVIAAAKASDLI